MVLLGWARGNPSSWVLRSFPSVRAKPAILNGGEVSVNTRDLGQLISFEEIFVERGYDMSLVNFVPDHVFDCGGHVGYFSAVAHAAFPQTKIDVFEPNPANIPWLSSNLGNLGEKATLHQAAVSSYDGSCHFDAEVSNGGHLDGSGHSGIEVMVKDLARCLRDSDGSALLMKMDIEGEEERLLPHILPVLPRKCSVFLETHGGAESRDHLVSLLKSAGFEVNIIRDRDRYSDLHASRFAA